MAKNTSDDLNVYSDKFRPFVTRWELAGADNITLPVVSGTYDFDVDWGDGTALEHSSNAIPNNTHAYTGGGIKTITITGLVTHWRFNGGGDRLLITDVLQGGYTGLINLDGGFRGCENLTFVDNSDWTRDVTTLAFCFYECFALNCDLDKWEVGKVTNMDYFAWQMFGFEGSLEGWDVSKVITMDSAFYWCIGFRFGTTDTMKNWNVSNCTNMSRLFGGHHVTEVVDVSDWDVSSCQNFSGMFQGLQDMVADYGKWDVSSATNMNNMFNGCDSFNHDLSSWDVSNVTTMFGMFEGNLGFNQDLSSWDVSNVIDFGSIFENATAFDQSLASWDISSGEAFGFVNMLSGCNMSTVNYNLTLVGWDAQVLLSGETIGVTGLIHDTTAGGVDGTAARQSIIDNDLWTFSGDTPP